MKRFLIISAILSVICLSAGCSGSTESSSQPASDSTTAASESHTTSASSSDSVVSEPVEDYEALLEQSLMFLTIEDDIVTDCASFASGVVIIPDGITEITWNAFEGCNSITEIRVPASVETIGANAFLNCTSLKTVKLSEGLLVLGGGAFDGCSSLNEVALPDSLGYVTDSVYGNSTATLTYKGQSYKPSDAVALCEAVVHYDENGFLIAGGNLIGALPSVSGDVDIPDTTEKICSAAFYETNINTLTIPASVKTIEENAFVFCGWINEVTIEEGVTTLEDHVFYDTDVSVIHLPSTLTDVCEYSLDINSNSTAYEYEGTEYYHYEAYTFGDHPLYELLSILMPEYEDGLLIEDGVLTDILYCRDSYFEPLSIPEGVTAIGEAAFSDTPVFFELQLPQTLTEISDKALYFTYIRNVEIPSGVKRIGDSAFYGCFNLETVKLSEGLEEIGGKAFADCDDLAEINIPSTVKFIDETAFEGSDNITVTYNGSSYTQENISDLYAAING